MTGPLKPITRQATNKVELLPIRIVQFGEGNFLRAFADWMIDVLNEKASFSAGVAVVQPIEQGMAAVLQSQEGLYHLLMQGLSEGKLKSERRLISCIQQVINPFKDLQAYLELAQIRDLSLILSNTTEAGIAFDHRDKPGNGVLAKTFPGKLTQLLWARYKHFEGDKSAGLGIIPCELIDKNGEKLKKAILQYTELWDLSGNFVQWIHQANYFANTLVDRIVPGFPHGEIEQIRNDLGFNDQLVVTSEMFHLWVIEGPAKFQELFPAHKHGLKVKYVDDLSPYRTRKVRILNGTHTSMVAVGMLTGLKTVKDSIEDNALGPFIRRLIFEEIIPTINLPMDELVLFAQEVIERFMNPFINHELKSISLNSISKFKVRVLPTMLDYIKQNNQAPQGLSTVFASLIKLYREGAQGKFALKDDAEYLKFFRTLASAASDHEIVNKTLSNESLWDHDLSKHQILSESVLTAYHNIESSSVTQSIETLPSA